MLLFAMAFGRLTPILEVAPSMYDVIPQLSSSDLQGGLGQDHVEPGSFHPSHDVESQL